MAEIQYATAKRATWYVLRTLLIITLVVVLCLAAFITAMHTSNIYILVTEGLEKRADVILKGGDISGMSEYFTQEFIAQDSALYSGEYDGFTITNYIYNISVKRILVMPWSGSTSVRVYDRMLTLSGAANEDMPEGSALPAWTPALYSVRLKKIDGRWFISDLRLIEQNPVEAPMATPDMSLLPPSE